MTYIGWLIAVLFSTLHILGIVSAFHAILYARTAQGAIVWSLSLLAFPYVTLPLYWTLARDKFQGYVKLLRARALSGDNYRQVEEWLRQLDQFRTPLPDDRRRRAQVFESLARLPFTRGNAVELLVDGEHAFGTMFRDIEKAKDYILLFFFIVRDDHLGNRLKEHLLEKASQGVRIFFLYDELGCMGLGTYIEELRRAGVEMMPFNTTQGSANKLQYNFRNHRKITIIDGRVAFVGGMNVEDDTLGLNPFYGPWRDTHVRLEGPGVQGVQLVWMEDWYWATRQLPKLEWTPQPSRDQDRDVLYLGTGPASQLDAGVLFFVHSIDCARERVWITSPYFVPDPSVTDSLILASLRGVDVRIILPQRWDMLVMYLAAFSYFPELEGTDIRIFRYQAGHPHQKVMLVDNDIAWVGSANIDNRSMRLNFEGNLVVLGAEFAAEVEEMLVRDLERSVEVGPEDYYSRGLVFKLGVKLARLFSPIL
ncbi:MAG: cardiolipin synthase [Vulcanimicrobiota bacterium]